MVKGSIISMGYKVKGGINMSGTNMSGTVL